MYSIIFPFASLLACQYVLQSFITSSPKSVSGFGYTSLVVIASSIMFLLQGSRGFINSRGSWMNFSNSDFLIVRGGYFKHIVRKRFFQIVFWVHITSYLLAY